MKGSAGLIFVIWCVWVSAANMWKKYSCFHLYDLGRLTMCVCLLWLKTSKLKPGASWEKTDRVYNLVFLQTVCEWPFFIVLFCSTFTDTASPISNSGVVFTHTHTCCKYIFKFRCVFYVLLMFAVNFYRLLYSSNKVRNHSTTVCDVVTSCVNSLTQDQ